MNILKKYRKNGVTTIGDDNLELDTPDFEIVDIRINTLLKTLEIDILHQVEQGSITREDTRTVNVNFNDLPAAVKTSGKAFLDSIEQEILKLPQYAGSVMQ